MHPTSLGRLLGPATHTSLLRSCVEMALEAPGMSPTKEAALAGVDAGLTAVFGLECLLKCVAFGFRWVGLCLG